MQDVDYQPFGTATSTGAQPGSNLYSNEQWNFGDALTAFGISKLGARLYDPAIGRFLSRDPLLVPATAATTNPYAFAANDPVNSSDPSGLFQVMDIPDELGRNSLAAFSMGFSSDGYGFGAHFGDPPNVDWSQPLGVPPGLAGGSGGSGGSGETGRQTRPPSWGSLNVTLNANTGTWETEKGETLDDVATETGLALADLENLNPQLANGSSAGGQVVSLPRELRILALEKAAKAIGDKDYAYDVEKGDFAAGKNKCNLFVNDIVERVGAKFPQRKNFWGHDSGPVSAGTLGDPSVKLSGLKLVADKDKAIGDVVGWKRNDFSDASGHTMIYAGQVRVIAKDGTVYRSPDGGVIGAGHDAVNYRSMSYMKLQKYVNPVYRRIAK